jgi:hypothetical protein
MSLTGSMRPLRSKNRNRTREREKNYLFMTGQERSEISPGWDYGEKHSLSFYQNLGCFRWHCHRSPSYWHSDFCANHWQLEHRRPLASGHLGLLVLSRKQTVISDQLIVLGFCTNETDSNKTNSDKSGSAAGLIHQCRQSFSLIMWRLIRGDNFARNLFWTRKTTKDV